MPTRKPAKGEVVKAKRSAGGTKGVKAKKATTKKEAAKKAVAKLTHGDAQSLLRNANEQWASLGGEIRALEELLKGLPPAEPLSDEVRREFQRLLQKLQHGPHCPPGNKCPPGGN